MVFAIEQPNLYWGEDRAPRADGMSGSGSSYYFDTGTLRMIVDSDCQWTVTVSPNSTAPLGPNTTFNNSTIGGSFGETPRFEEAGPWTMSWSYDCHGSRGSFYASLDLPRASTLIEDDPTVSESSTGNSGTIHDSYVGAFSFAIMSSCDWSISVTGPPIPAACNKLLPSGTVVGMANTTDGKGYWIASSTGAVAACGDAQPYGDGQPGTAAITGTPDGNGYWLVTGSGQVQPFGSAPDEGSIASNVDLAKPIVAMAADPATGGYWLLGGDGGVFSYNAPFYGSTGNIRLNKPAVGMAATPDGNGYYFVASDGGIFAFGTAPFYGSTGNIALAQPVVGMAIDPATRGYWMDASDGGIFAFHAPFDGSTGNVTLAKPCVGMAAMPDGSGYRFVAADGGIFSFHAPFEGSAA